jgi:hypothetical protein
MAASIATATASKTLTGGCACGTVRYRLKATPYDTGWCHCRICQRVSGSGGMVFTTVAKADFEIEIGADRLGQFPSTPFGERGYCRDCGSPLTISVAHQTDEIDVTVGSLDEPDSVTPGFHLYMTEAPGWIRIADQLPQYDALRPETRGLKKGQTEV